MLPVSFISDTDTVVNRPIDISLISSISLEHCVQIHSIANIENQKQTPFQISKLCVLFSCTRSFSSETWATPQLVILDFVNLSVKINGQTID